MKALARRAIDVLVEEPNVLMIPGPVTVFGDIRGESWPTFQTLFYSREDCLAPDKKYLFLGNLVKSVGLKLLTFILALKIKYPSQISVLRGNQECNQLSQVHGFSDECKRLYGNDRIWTQLCTVFNALPYAAVVAKSIFCVHGGLSPQLETIDDITRLERFQPVPFEGLLTDLLWSDPNDQEGCPDWSPSPRGAGHMFGPEATKKFLKQNRFKIMLRSHQVVMNEPYYKWDHDQKCCTIFSCPNLSYRCANHGSLVHIDKKGNLTFETFEELKQMKLYRDKSELLPNFDDHFDQQTGEFTKAFKLTPEFKEKWQSQKPVYRYQFL